MKRKKRNHVKEEKKQLETNEEKTNTINEKVNEKRKQVESNKSVEESWRKTIFQARTHLSKKLKIF